MELYITTCLSLQSHELTIPWSVFNLKNSRYILINLNSKTTGMNNLDTDNDTYVYVYTYVKWWPARSVNHVENHPLGRTRVIFRLLLFLHCLVQGKNR